MSDKTQTTGIVAAGQTVTNNQALVFTGLGSQEVRPAAAGEEAMFAGFAANGGTAGDRILVTFAGEAPFIPSINLGPANENAALKLAADGKLALAVPTDNYVMRYRSKAIWGGQGGTLTAGDQDDVDADQTGFGLIEKGVA